MRISPLLHPLAVLRNTIGLTQKEMGDLVNRAARTIQAVELRKLSLSEDLAMLIAEATGIDVGWLLAGQPSVPPRKGLTAQHMGAGSGVYTKSDYEFHRAFLESPAASREEIERVVQSAIPIENQKGEKVVTMSLPVMKGALLVHKKRVMESIDQQMIEALQLLLEKTIVARGGDLVRWKMRRLLLELAEENAVKLLLPTAPALAVSHVHVMDTSPKNPGRRRPAKG